MTQVATGLTAERAAAAMEAMKSGDRSRIDEYWSPTVRFLVPGNHQFAGWREGVDAFMAFHKALVRVSGGTIRMKPFSLALNEDDGYSVEMNDCTAQREGSDPNSTSPYDRLDLKACDILRWENGIIVEGWAGIFGDGMTQWNLFLSPVGPDGARSTY